MLHVLDVRDAMDSERFQQVQFDPMNDPKKVGSLLMGLVLPIARCLFICYSEIRCTQPSLTWTVDIVFSNDDDDEQITHNVSALSVAAETDAKEQGECVTISHRKHNISSFLSIVYFTTLSPLFISLHYTALPRFDRDHSPARSESSVLDGLGRQHLPRQRWVYFIVLSFIQLLRAEATLFLCFWVALSFNYNVSQRLHCIPYTCCLGKDYMTTNKKTNSAPALFKFIGIDLFETPEAHKNMAAHPRNRVHLARERYENSSICLFVCCCIATAYIY